MFEGFEYELPFPPFGLHWDVGPHMGQYVAVPEAAAPAGVGPPTPGAHAPASARARIPPQAGGAGLGNAPDGAPNAPVPDTPGDPAPGPAGPERPVPDGAAAVPDISPQAFFWAVHNHTRMHHDALRSQMSDFEDWLDRMSVFFEPTGALP